jgi:hypothetical protein
VIKLTAVLIEAYHCCQLHTKFDFLSNILLSRLIPYTDEIIGDHQCGFRRNKSTTDQIFYIHQLLEKKWEYNGTVHQLFIDFNEAYDSVRREVLYNILIEFGIPRKLVGIIKMSFNYTYSKDRIGKNLSDKFTIENGLKHGDALSPLLYNYHRPTGGLVGSLLTWFGCSPSNLQSM